MNNDFCIISCIYAVRITYVILAVNLPLVPLLSFIKFYEDIFRQGANWRDFRTKVNPAMLKPKLVKLYAPGLDDIAQELVERQVKYPGFLVYHLSL